MTMTAGPSGWTLDTLYLHLAGVINETRKQSEQRFNDSEKTFSAVLAAQKEAAEKAERSDESRHVDLVLRLNSTVDTLTEKITSLALHYEGTVGRSGGQERAWGFLVGFVGVAAATISIMSGLR